MMAMRNTSKWAAEHAPWQSLRQGGRAGMVQGDGQRGPVTRGRSPDEAETVGQVRGRGPGIGNSDDAERLVATPHRCRSGCISRSSSTLTRNIRQEVRKL